MFGFSRNCYDISIWRANKWSRTKNQQLIKQTKFVASLSFFLFLSFRFDFFSFVSVDEKKRTHLGTLFCTAEFLLVQYRFFRVLFSSSLCQSICGLQKKKKNVWNIIVCSPRKATHASVCACVWVNVSFRALFCQSVGITSQFAQKQILINDSNVIIHIIKSSLHKI